MRRLVVLLLLLLPPVLGRHQLQWLSWSSWGSKHLSGQPELTDTHANLIQDQNISFLLSSSTSLPGMLLLPYRGPDSLFVTDRDVPAHTAGCRRLATDWERRLDGIIAQITTHQPRIRGVQLGDELVDGGLTVNNLSALATYLRQRLPPRVFIYTNEGFRYENPCLGPNHTTCKGSGAGPARCVQGRCIPATWKYFPADIDAISLDGYANSAGEVTFARSQYERYFFPLLRPHQKVWVVPGIYGHNCSSDGSTRMQNASCLARTDSILVAKLRGYLSWAEAEPRLEGIIAWHWPSLAGPPSGDWGMQMGGVAYPQLLGLVQQVVSELLPPQPVALKLTETERRTHASKSDDEIASDHLQYMGFFDFKPQEQAGWTNLGLTFYRGWPTAKDTGLPGQLGAWNKLKIPSLYYVHANHRRAGEDLEVGRWAAGWVGGTRRGGSGAFQALLWPG